MVSWHTSGSKTWVHLLYYFVWHNSYSWHRNSLKNELLIPYETLRLGRQFSSQKNVWIFNTWIHADDIWFKMIIFQIILMNSFEFSLNILLRSLLHQIVRSPTIFVFFLFIIILFFFFFLHWNASNSVAYRFL